MGDTIYNLMAMEKLETDPLDRPYNPPKILQTKVVHNPFNDIFPRDLLAVRPDLAQKIQEEIAKKNGSSQSGGLFKKQATNLVKKQNAVSLMEDEEEELAVGRFKLPTQKKKDAPTLPEQTAKSTKTTGLHQLLKSDMGISDMSEQDIQTLKRKEEELLESQRLKQALKSSIQDNSLEDATLGKRVDDSMKERIANDIKQMKESGAVTVNPKTGRAEINIASHIGRDSNKSRSSSSSSSSSGSSSSSEHVNPEIKKLRDQQKALYEKMNFESLAFKQNPQGSGGAEAQEKETKSFLSVVELKRYKYLKENSGKMSQEATLKKLEEFRNKLKNKEPRKKGQTWMDCVLKTDIIDSAKAYKHQEMKAAMNEPQFPKENYMLKPHVPDQDDNLQLLSQSMNQ